MRRRGLVLVDGRRYGRKVSASAPTMPVGLVMALEFEGDGVDATGRGNTATLVSSPTTVAGLVGNALHFTAGSCVTVPGSADVTFGGAIDWTLKFKYKPDSVAAGTEPIFEKGLSNGSAQEAYCQRSGANVFFYVHNIGLSVSSNDGELLAGQWNDVLVRYTEAAKTLEMQVNGGQLRSVNTTTGITRVDSHQLRIGKTYAGNGSCGIDQWFFWHRALTAAEAAFTFNRGLGSSYSRISSGTARAASTLSAVTLASGTGFYGFTDVIYAPTLGLYVACWREATAHGLSPTGRVRVATSPDMSTWTNRALLASPNASSDLRDPKLLWNPSTSKVCVYAATPKSDNTLWPSVVFQSSDAVTWDAGTLLTGLTANDWPWRPMFNGNDSKVYVAAYGALDTPTVNLRLYSSTNGVAFTRIGSDPWLSGQVDEAVLVLLNDLSMLALVREDDGTWSQLGVSAASPWTSWTFQATKPATPAAQDSRIGGHAVVQLSDHSILGAGRYFVSVPPGQRSSLFWVLKDTRMVVEAFSFGAPQTTSGESGYCGLVDLGDGTVLTTHYETPDQVTYYVKACHIRLPN